MTKAYDKQIGGSHYQKYKIQPSKFVIENELLYPEGCAIKYIIRHRDKGKKQDILKAIHFLEMIMEKEKLLIITYMIVMIFLLIVISLLIIRHQI